MWTRGKSDSTAAFLLLSVIFVRFLSGQQVPATDTAPPTKSAVKFDFERPGLPVPKFTLNVNEDGTGTYVAEDASPQGAQHIRRELTLTSATTQRIFTLARAAHLSQATCVSKAKNVADTGKKTLTSTASGTMISCTYNYSENKDVDALTDIFQGIAETMDQGRRLDFLHRFDRLGLNDAVASLDQEVSAGRALEVGTIAASLRSIAADAEVMQRVRTKASALLAHVPEDLQQPTP